MKAKFEINNASRALSIAACFTELGFDFNLRVASAYFFTVEDCDFPPIQRFMEKTSKYYGFQFTMEDE